MLRTAVLLAMLPLAACAVTVPWTSECSIKYTNLVEGDEANNVPGVDPDAVVMTESFQENALAFGSPWALESNYGSHYINVPDSLLNTTLVSFTGWESFPGKWLVEGVEWWTIDIQVVNLDVDVFFFFHFAGARRLGAPDTGDFPELIADGTNSGWTLVPETTTRYYERFGLIRQEDSACNWGVADCWYGEMVLYKKTLTEHVTQIKLARQWGEWIGGLAFGSWEELCQAPTTTTTTTATTTATVTMTSTATNTTTATTMITATNSAGGRGTINGLLAGAAAAAALSTCSLSVK